MITESGRVQLCVARDESLLIVSRDGAGITGDITHLIPYPAYSASDHADRWMRASGITRVGEWVRHDGYLLAPYAPLAMVDTDTATRYGPKRTCYACGIAYTSVHYAGEVCNYCERSGYPDISESLTNGDN